MTDNLRERRHTPPAVPSPAWLTAPTVERGPLVSLVLLGVRGELHATAGLDVGAAWRALSDRTAEWADALSGAELAEDFGGLTRAEVAREALTDWSTGANGFSPYGVRVEGPALDVFRLWSTVTSGDAVSWRALTGLDAPDEGVTVAVPPPVVEARPTFAPSASGQALGRLLAAVADAVEGKPVGDLEALVAPVVAFLRGAA